jgi:hypothetical protein
MLSTHDDFRNLDTILVGSHGARGRPDEELSEPDGRRRRQPSIGNLPVTASFPRIGFQAWMPIDPQRRWLGQNTIAHSRFKGAEFVVSNPKWVVRGGLRTNVGDLRVQSVRPCFPSNAVSVDRRAGVPGPEWRLNNWGSLASGKCHLLNIVPVFFPDTGLFAVE